MMDIGIEHAITLIKKFEGFRPEAYLCPARRWTIGYGTRRNVTQGMMVTRVAADQMLRDDLLDIAEQIHPLIAVELTPTQWAVLLSLTYNIGVEAFRRSTLRSIINNGEFSAVPNELLRWVKGGRPIRVLPGLVARRTAEGKLWASELHSGQV